MNNKGFMMAEVVVVSSIVLVTLVSFYVSYNKIISLYNQRINYYDVTTLYKLAYYRDNELSNDKSYGKKKDSDGEKIYYVDTNNIKNKNLNVENQTFKEYLEYLSTSLDFESLKKNKINNMLIMENCDTDGKSNCKYSYLEVWD